jgi:hypothetical protein
MAVEILGLPFHRLRLCFLAILLHVSAPNVVHLGQLHSNSVENLGMSIDVHLARVKFNQIAWG